MDRKHNDDPMGQLIDLYGRARAPKAERPRPALQELLGFLPQIQIGSHFRIVVGVSSAGSATEGSAVERVIEYQSGAFRLVNCLSSAGRRTRARLRAGDLLLSIERESIAHSRLAELAKNMDGMVISSESDKNDDRYARISRSIEKVKAEWTGCIVGQDAIALRPKSGDASSNDLLKFFDFLSLGMRLESWLEKTTSGRDDRQVITALKRLTIPILPDRLIRTLEEWAQMAEELSLHGNSEEPADEFLLTAQTQTELDQRILKLETENYAFRQALDSANDSEFQIRNFYPFPISYPYRMLTAPTHHLELLDQEFAVIEGMLAFLASITLAISRPPSTRVRAWFDEANRFASAAGTWKTIATTASAELKPQNDDGLANHLKMLWRGKFERNAERLVGIRNDKAHQRRRSGSSRLSEEARDLLARCFEDIAFLTRFPIVNVFDPKVPRTGVCVHQVHLYRGDHPVHARETIEREVPLPASLYIFSDEGPQDLFPFISVRECGHCGETETFFLDKKDNSSWFVKSFEHSHSAKAQDVAGGLQA